MLIHSEAFTRKKISYPPNCYHYFSDITRYLDFWNPCISFSNAVLEIHDLPEEDSREVNITRIKRFYIYDDRKIDGSLIIWDYYTGECGAVKASTFHEKWLRHIMPWDNSLDEETKKVYFLFKEIK